VRVPIDCGWARCSFGGFDAYWLLRGFLMDEKHIHLCERVDDLHSDNISMALCFKVCYENAGSYKIKFGIYKKFAKI